MSDFMDPQLSGPSWEAVELAILSGRLEDLLEVHNGVLMFAWAEAWVALRPAVLMAHADGFPLMGKEIERYTAEEAKTHGAVEQSFYADKGKYHSDVAVYSYADGACLAFERCGSYVLREAAVRPQCWKQLDPLPDWLSEPVGRLCCVDCGKTAKTEGKGKPYCYPCWSVKYGPGTGALTPPEEPGGSEPTPPPGDAESRCMACGHYHPWKIGPGLYKGCDWCGLEKVENRTDFGDGIARTMCGNCTDHWVQIRFDSASAAKPREVCWPCARQKAVAGRRKKFTWV